MKALVCEMCTSNDIVKQDGLYVCQNCGTKYSIEEAKKMMLDGSVVIDETSKIDNYYKLAESAEESGNNQEAESYCNKILEIDPNHYKAWLIKGKAVGWQSTLAKIKIDESVTYFSNALNCAPDEEKTQIKSDIVLEFSKLSFALCKLAVEHLMEYVTEQSADMIINQIIPMILKCFAFIDSIITEIDFEGTTKDAIQKNKKGIAEILYQGALNARIDCFKKYVSRGIYQSSFEDYREQCDLIKEVLIAEIAFCAVTKNNEKIVEIYKSLISIYEFFLTAIYEKNDGQAGCLSVTEKQVIRSNIFTWVSKIKEIDPSYEYTQPQPKKESSGCYIATCVYGSYDCPQVWTLRRFRDFTLAKSWYGRLFIKTYYKISPKFVKLFGNTKWFKKLWGGRLDKLKEKGFEDTAYYDR